VKAVIIKLKSCEMLCRAERQTPQASTLLEL